MADDATLHVAVTKACAIAISLYGGDTLLLRCWSRKFGGVVLIR